jgi:hypothetical protein
MFFLKAMGELVKKNAKSRLDYQKNIFKNSFYMSTKTLNDPIGW